MNKTHYLLVLLVLLAGCTTPNSRGARTDAATPVQVTADGTPMTVSHGTAKEVVLRTLGHATVHKSQRSDEAQERLLAQRAAKMEAMRAMAERLYGIHIQGESSASGMKIENDSFRTVVNAYLRGAEVVGVTALDDRTYEAVVELKVSDTLIKQLNDQVTRLDGTSGKSFYYSE